MDQLKNISIKKQKVSFAVLVMIFSIAVLLFSCNNKNGPAAELKNLSITWKVVKNEPINDSWKCFTRFTFANKGKNKIDGDNWTLYFNQTTLFVDGMNKPSLGVVENINGDLYKFVPGKDFSIAPGDSLVVECVFKGMLIKEGDAPAGLYTVYDNKKDEPVIAKVENYTILPFNDITNIFTGEVFKKAMPTPENEFEKNSYISALPTQDVGIIIPTPVKTVMNEGKVTLDKSTVVYYQRGLETEADFLIDYAKKNFNASITKKEGLSSKSNTITLTTSDIKVNGTSSEVYQLKVVAGKGVEIIGGDAAGVFYGVQSFLSILSKGNKTGDSLEINGIEISDAPRFTYRGFHFDVCRNFQKKEALFKLIDVLSFYKVNHIQFRLTEDEAWRLEIAGLPELTQVGARRGHTLDDSEFLPPSFGSGGFVDAPDNYGNGYYTRQDFIEIIKYANKRHIVIIPEICFPGHTRAAIKSMEARYTSFMGKKDTKAAEEYRLIDPNDKSEYCSAQQYKDNVVDVSKESVYHFYETVVKDIKAMYDEAGVEFKIFHTGGDEVANGAWAKSPSCLELMKKNPEITDPRHLHAYFFKRVLAMLKKYNLTVGGWEEVVIKKDPASKVVINKEFSNENVVPYVWDNTGNNMDLGDRIANAGYKVVLCNVTNLYFDLAYNTDPKEPGLYWGGFQDAIDPFVLIPFDVFKSAVYTEYGWFDENPKMPAKLEKLKPEARKNIMGIQAQLWTETVKGQQMMEYYLLPKLLAFSEKAWAQPRAWENEPDNKKRIASIKKDWNEFSNRIGLNEFPRLNNLYGGFNYRIPTAGAKLANGVLEANVPFPGLIIRYTTDGSEPTVSSTQYLKPIKANGQVKLRVFNSTGRFGRVVTISNKD